jgi:hypothetical protein
LTGVLKNTTIEQNKNNVVFAPAFSTPGARMAAAPARRRKPKLDTERGQAIRAAARHLRDLKRWHGRPPPDLAIPQSPMPARIEPAPVSSFCTSAAELCAEATR